MSLSIDLLNPPAHSLVLIPLAITHAPVFAIAVDHAMIRLHYIDVCNSGFTNGLIMSVALDSSLVTRHFITSRFCSFSLGSNLLDLWLDLYPPAVCPWFAFCDIQHTPVILASMLVGINIHDTVAKGPKLLALQWLCEVVRQHLFCRTIFDIDFAVGHPISDEEVSDVDVASPLAA